MNLVKFRKAICDIINNEKNLSFDAKFFVLKDIFREMNDLFVKYVDEEKEDNNDNVITKKEQTVSLTSPIDNTEELANKVRALLNNSHSQSETDKLLELMKNGNFKIEEEETKEDKAE